jgi:hypothetical protein
VNPVPLTLARLERFGITPDAASAIATAHDAETVTIDIDGDAWRALLASVRPAKTPEDPAKRATATDANEPRGLGDSVANAIKRATFGLVKPCGGCAKRQAALNKAFPYSKP